MVVFENASAYDAAPQPGGTKIPGGPVYDLQAVQAVARKCFVLWTRKCTRDVRSLALDDEDICGLIDQLTAAHYRDSEWCCNGKQWVAACDSYVVVKEVYSDVAHKFLDEEYFLKFAINKKGQMLLIVSCHLSR